MPFTPYQSDFDADTLRVLRSAYDRACLELLDHPDVLIDEHMARDLIAQRIVAAAHEHGERDLDRLVRYALERLRLKQPWCVCYLMPGFFHLPQIY